MCKSLATRAYQLERSLFEALLLSAIESPSARALTLVDSSLANPWCVTVFGSFLLDSVVASEATGFAMFVGVGWFNVYLSVSPRFSTQNMARIISAKIKVN